MFMLLPSTIKITYLFIHQQTREEKWVDLFWLRQLAFISAADKSKSTIERSQWRSNQPNPIKLNHSIKCLWLIDVFDGLVGGGALHKNKINNSIWFHQLNLICFCFAAPLASASLKRFSFSFFKFNLFILRKGRLSRKEKDNLIDSAHSQRTESN